jgi:hypothetical protein
MKIDNILTEPGKFVVGCNYWASHAGTSMWSDWRADVVEEDLKQLAEAGIQVMRVFPLWPDFQPLTLLKGGGGQPVEFRLGEAPLPYDEAGQAGVSPTAIAHFNEFAGLAHKYGLKLIVGLLTGWMSGRLFVPPALEGLEILTDPVAIQWQVRFVRYFVRRFKDHPAVLAWDLGNECNCMTAVPSRQAAWLWASTITNAIRVEDASRPVVSGMHSLTPARNDHWTMQDQGEITDLLTTHPYPYFTPHCDHDPVNTLRSCLHATAESRFYADIGGKPCLAEEVGTLGPVLASEKIAADYIRTVLFSLWAHDCHGLLWWCAFDQLHLVHAPYDWASCERELGLIRADRQPKPVVKELGQFGRFIQNLPIQTLPARTTQAVCILTEGQDQWGAAYSSFILAQQAGFDIQFQYMDQPLKPASLYLMPSVSGGSPCTRRFWLELLQRVKDGATLYVSHHDGLLSPINEPFGIQIQTRQRRTQPVQMHMDGLDGAPRLSLRAPIRLDLAPAGAAVLGREPNGNPVFTCASYGLGKIYFLSVPIELELSNLAGGFHGPEAWPFWKIYQHIAGPFLAHRALRKDNPFVGLTEHPLDAERRVIIAINYSPEPQKVMLSPAEGWRVDPPRIRRVDQVWYGQPPVNAESGWACEIGPNDAVVFVIRMQ